MEITFTFTNEQWTAQEREAETFGRDAKAHVIQWVQEAADNTVKNQSTKDVDALAEKLRALPPDKQAAALAAADAAAAVEISKP